jgi:hypothetical protein
VQEGQRGSESRNLVPVVENELRQLEQKNRAAADQLERGNCYEYFLFSKTLRRTRKCVDLASEVDNTKRRIADLDTQLQQLTASSGRSYQDDIVRELARNNCGATYQQQARRRDGDGWDEGESGGSGNGVGNFGNLGYATYRTICVRLCDGYYFPVSFSTLPNHFERDAEVCQSKCAAPAELYYHQNPGAGVDQATSAMTNEPYTQLKSAFRYRKEFVAGCSCKMAEYVPDPSMPQPQQQGALPGAESVGGAVDCVTGSGSPAWRGGTSLEPAALKSYRPDSLLYARGRHTSPARSVRYPAHDDLSALCRYCVRLVISGAHLLGGRKRVCGPSMGAVL